MSAAVQPAAPPSARFSRALLGATAAALAEALKLVHPADTALSRFFRTQPKLGRRDREMIADTVFAVLRRRRLVERLAGRGSPRELVLAAWAALLGANVRELAALGGNVAAERLGEYKREASAAQPFEVECEFPDWLIERLRGRFDDDAVLAIARGMLRPAPLDLRVNLARISREEVLAGLRAEAIDAQATPYSPAGVRLTGKPAIRLHRFFLEGLVEVQDEGSQLLCYLVAPRRGEMVVDFCAGAGGKTLALGMLMRSSGRVYAFDVSDKRLAQFKPRLARSGLSNVHPQRIQGERDPRLGRLAGKIDRVLVDAPCSGLGTLRRCPDVKWRRTPEELGDFTRRQAAILGGAAKLLKPGGRLVYATCSILEEENAAIVGAFLSANAQFVLVPAGEVLQRERIDLPAEGMIELWPHRHGTDGFFAAVLERRR